MWPSLLALQSELLQLKAQRLLLSSPPELTRGDEPRRAAQRTSNVAGMTRDRRRRCLLVQLRLLAQLLVGLQLKKAQLSSNLLPNRPVLLLLDQAILFLENLQLQLPQLLLSLKKLLLRRQLLVRWRLGSSWAAADVDIVAAATDMAVIVAVANLAVIAPAANVAVLEAAANVAIIAAVAKTASCGCCCCGHKV